MFYRENVGYDRDNRKKNGSNYLNLFLLAACMACEN